MKRFKLLRIINETNIEKVHKWGGILSLIIVLSASAYGVIVGQALLYVVLYIMRALGIYLLFYVLRCVVLGEERIISAGWTDDAFTRKNYPLQFIFLIFMIIWFSAIMIGTWFVFDV